MYKVCQKYCHIYSHDGFHSAVLFCRDLSAPQNLTKMTLPFGTVVPMAEIDNMDVVDMVSVESLPFDRVRVIVPSHSDKEVDKT